MTICASISARRRRSKGEDETSYQPVLAVFAVAALMALAMSWFGASTSCFTIRAAEWFIAVSMCILAILKLQDLESFSNDVPRTMTCWRSAGCAMGIIYPFGEALAGVLMIAGALLWIAIPVALFIGTIGAVSVIKAVYVDKRELKCACVGGGSNVPLGFLSMTENLMMVAMALWMLFT